MADDEKKMETKHELRSIVKNHVQIYRLSPTQHEVKAYTKNLVLLPGLEKTLQIEEDDTDIIVMTLGHAVANDGRADLQIMIDQKVLTMNYPHDPNKYPGTGLSHSKDWSPLISIGSTTLKKGVYHIYAVLMNAADNGKIVYLNGTGMIIQMYKPHVVNKWVDIDLDDEMVQFNKDLEYQIEIKGKSFATAITVNKDNLWFFYADTKKGSSGIKSIYYKNKREVENNCVVTKIQCRLRNS